MKHPDVALLTLDIREGDRQNHDLAKVVHRGKMDLKKAVFVFAFARARDQQNFRVALLAVNHVNILDHHNERARSVDLSLNAGLSLLEQKHILVEYFHVQAHVAPNVLERIQRVKVSDFFAGLLV